MGFFQLSKTLSLGNGRAEFLKKEVLGTVYLSMLTYAFFPAFLPAL